MGGQIVKVFGERNTGTRAVQALLRQVPGIRHRVSARRAPPTYDAAVQAAVEGQMRGHWKRLYLHAMRDDLAARHAGDDPWKHACPRLTDTMRAAQVATILMVRNPYSWLISLARRPYHIKGPNAASLEDFAARPWMTEAREGMPAVVLSPMVLWSTKAAASLAYASDAKSNELACKIIRFESFVNAPGEVASAAFEELRLPGTSLRVRARNTKPDEAPLEVLQDYYAREDWRAWLTRETVARINALVDWPAATALGYERLTPSDFPEALTPAVAARIAAEMASLSAPSHREACPTATA